MRCGQDVPWTASAKDGRLACSRCGMSSENGNPTNSWHVPLNLPVKDLHGAHASGHSPSTFSADMPIQGANLDPHAWPVASAYDGWDLDEQLSHIREVLDSLASSAPVADSTGSKTERRFDAMHHEKQGLHRRPIKSNDSLIGRFVFGLVFLMLGTGILVLSIASILPQHIWLQADVPIVGVLLQVLGVFLIGLGLSAQFRRFHAALHAQNVKRYRRFDKPQMEQQPPHVNVKSTVASRHLH